MAKYNFEGDLEKISDKQLEFINKVILEQVIKVKKVTFEPVGKAGDNFAASVKRIIIDGEDRSLRMVAKIAPQLEGPRGVVGTAFTFANEHVIYTEFLPKIEQYQNEAGVPAEDRLRYAKCYGSSIEQPNEVILLEDLNTSDFIMLDKFKSLPDSCIRSVLKNFAILHSFSFALKHREPEKFEEFKHRFVDIWSINSYDERAIIYMAKLENDLLLLFEEEFYKNKIRNTMTDMVAASIELHNLELSNKYSVIQQGDAWTNNFMFRFKEDELLESIIIDYQTAKNGNPVSDVLYTIFSSTDYEYRKKNFYDWIDYYHSELDKSLSYFNLKVDSVFPRKEFEVGMKKHGKFIFAQCCVCCNILMRSTEESVEVMEAMHKSDDLSALMQSMSADTLQEASRTKIRDKITGLIKSFTEYGLI